MNVKRKLSVFDCAFYNKKIQNNEDIFLFFNNKNNKIRAKEIREKFCSIECVYCGQFDLKCNKIFPSVISFLKHIKPLEKKLNRHLVFLPEENKRPFKTEANYNKCTLPTFHPNLEEMRNFTAYINSLNEIGKRFGAVKIVPPEGKLILK